MLPGSRKPPGLRLPTRLQLRQELVTRGIHELAEGVVELISKYRSGPRQKEEETTRATRQEREV